MDIGAKDHRDFFALKQECDAITNSSDNLTCRLECYATKRTNRETRRVRALPKSRIEACDADVFVELSLMLEQAAPSGSDYLSTLDWASTFERQTFSEVVQDIAERMNQPRGNVQRALRQIVQDAELHCAVFKATDEDDELLGGGLEVCTYLFYAPELLRGVFFQMKYESHEDDGNTSYSRSSSPVPFDEEETGSVKRQRTLSPTSQEEEGYDYFSSNEKQDDEIA